MTNSGVHADSTAGLDLLGVRAPAALAGDRPGQTACAHGEKETHRPRWYGTVRASIAGHDLSGASREPNRPTMFSLSGYVKIPVFFVETTDGPGPGGMALRRAADGAMIGDVAGRKRRGPGTPSTRDTAANDLGGEHDEHQ